MLAPTRNAPLFPNTFPSNPSRPVGAYANPKRGPKFKLEGFHQVGLPFAGPLRAQLRVALGMAFWGTPWLCRALRSLKYCVSGMVEVDCNPCASYGGR